MLADDSRCSTDDLSFSVPFDPDVHPELRLVPTGAILNDLTSHIFMLYYRFTELAFLAECNAYVQAEEDQSQCFGDPPYDVCLSIRVGELKVRLSLLGWIGLILLDYHMHSPAAYLDRWSALGVTVKTREGFPLATTFPFRNYRKADKFGYTGSLEKDPVCDSDMSYNSTLRENPPGAQIETKVNYSGVEIEQKSILYTIFMISRGLIWDQESRDPIALDIGTDWLVNSPPENDVLKMTLLADKDYKDGPLSWAWLALGLDSILYDLATTRIWDEFEATASFKENGVAFLKIEMLKNKGPAIWTAVSGSDKTAAGDVEIRRFEPGGKLVETIKTGPMKGLTPDPHGILTGSGTGEGNSPQTS